MEYRIGTGVKGGVVAVFKPAKPITTVTIRGTDYDINTKELYTLLRSCIAGKAERGSAVTRDHSTGKFMYKLDTVAGSVYMTIDNMFTLTGALRDIAITMEESYD